MKTEPGTKPRLFQDFFAQGFYELIQWYLRLKQYITYCIKNPGDQQNTVFCMLWDEENLYVFFKRSTSTIFPVTSEKAYISRIGMAYPNLLNNLRLLIID